MCDQPCQPTLLLFSWKEQAVSLYLAAVLLVETHCAGNDGNSEAGLNVMMF